MTTKELKRKLNEFDFVKKVIEEGDNIIVVDHSGYYIGFIDKELTHQINTYFHALDNLKTNEKQQLFDLLCEYAKTPNEDREEKTLYTAVSRIDSIRRLYRDVGSDYNILLNTFDESDGLTFEFTEEELKDVKGINIWDSDEWLIEEAKE